MGNLSCRLAALSIIVLAGLPGTAGAAPPAAEAARQRPIMDFVSQQGTYCVRLGGPSCTLFEPPVGNILGWIEIRDGARYLARVDYAGLADAYLGGALGTTFEGTITERPLPDGTAEVSVRLHTRNALAWVSRRLPNEAGGWGPSVLVFGHPGQQVAAGAEPALADLLFQLVFINTAPGAPLPDMTQFSFDPAYLGTRIFEAIHARASGELADGTPAELRIQQVGLLGVYQGLLDHHDEAGWEPPTTNGIWSDAGWPVGDVELRPSAAP
jgi:hypothetical protein